MDRTRLIASAISPPIMITDDHKRNVAKNSKILTEETWIDHTLTFPSIFKIVPTEGPMYGGIEVTLLGSNFTSNSQIYFGSSPAPLVFLQSPSTMIVRLPPSIVAGPVPISIHTQMSDSNVFFNYKNDLDRAMMELALQLIGMKMTGRVDDAKDVALRIIQENAMSPPPISSSHTSNHIERTIITSLTATETYGAVDFRARDFIAFKASGGQTLLHLAALQGHLNLFEYLASFDGELIDQVDHNGFTAADLAYLCGMLPLLTELGLDEDYLVPSTVVQDRYKVLVEKLSRDQLSMKQHHSWLAKGLGWLRRPSKLRGSIQRLRTNWWRRSRPSSIVKPYYYKQLIQRQSSSASSIGPGVSIKKRMEQMMSGAHQYYRDCSLFGSWRARDLMLWYFWVPIFIAASLLWAITYSNKVVY